MKEKKKKKYEAAMTVVKPMIIYENTVPALFVRRLNRFTAEVLIDGIPETVHVKNTGRLRGRGGQHQNDRSF